MKNRYNRLLFIVSVLFIIFGLLLKILHYSIGFLGGYGFIIFGIILNISVFFFPIGSNENKKE
jgi:nitrate reductase NapE component